MRDSKYLKEEAGGDDEKDNAEADQDGEIFKKRTHKNAKFAHKKGFGGPQGAKSFARKRQRVK